MSNNLVTSSFEQQVNFEVRQKLFQLLLEIFDLKVEARGGAPLLMFARGATSLSQPFYTAFQDDLFHNLEVLSGRRVGELKTLDTSELKSGLLAHLNQDIVGKQTGLNIFISNDPKSDDPFSISIERQYGPEGDLAGFPEDVLSYKISSDGTIYAITTEGELNEINSTDAEALTNAFNKVITWARKIVR
jgi:hypothetical protein